VLTGQSLVQKLWKVTRTVSKWCKASGDSTIMLIGYSLY